MPPLPGLPNHMQPKQMRLTFRPVLPSLVYSMVAPSLCTESLRCDYLSWTSSYAMALRAQLMALAVLFGASVPRMDRPLTTLAAG